MQAVNKSECVIARTQTIYDNLPAESPGHYLVFKKTYKKKGGGKDETSILHKHKTS